MDSRYPCHYLMDRRVVRLSDAAHRLFVVATAWCVENRTDGVIEQDDLDLIPRAKIANVEELVVAGLMEATDNGWFLTEYEKYQTSAAKLEAALQSRRENDRKRQAKSRAKRKPDGDVDPATGEIDPVSARVSRDGHVTVGGEERRGEERRGEASEDREVAAATHDDTVTSWPVAKIPQPAKPPVTAGDNSFPVDLPPILCNTFGCSEKAVDDDRLCARHGTPARVEETAA